MTTGDVKFASIAFAVMTLSVAVNLFAMQGERAGARIETSALQGGGVRPTGLVGAEDLGPARAPEAKALKVAPPPDAALPPVNSAELTRGIQRELNARGYDAGPPDGVVGQVTRAAIMAYEYDYGLPLTAEPSQELLSQIILGSSGPPPHVPAAAARRIGADAEAVIRNVQSQLQAQGYSAGPIDGKPGDQLARAIRAFEIDQKLKETGRISGPLVSRLVRLQVKAPRAERGQTARR